MPESDALHGDEPLFDDDEPITDEERAELHRPLLELLGIETEFAPEELAPQIDERRLTAFVRDKVSRKEWQAVWRMVTMYRSWFDAWRTLMRNEAR